MPRTLVTPERNCLMCGEAIPQTWAAVAERRKFCSDKHRYQYWKAEKSKELLRLVRSLARHGIVIPVEEEKEQVSA